uniref:Cas1p 10 TM acyl transferase domain-containing protein n=1 Tax=Corethron hystrix TaxID=216773 RepID=A0A7S1G276_9STRA|mmetsp:Transcript_9766/g.21746  ORF Transcript_9766/g.21746 Transcript_9766/m.21746 type:complete len:1019 (+) Transcript_9766:131-3187(+)
MASPPTLPWYQMHSSSDVMAGRDPATSSVAAAILFGSVGVACAGMYVRCNVAGDVRAINAAYNPRASPLTFSYASVYTLFHHITVFGAILLFAYMAEFHPPYPHSEKSYDRDQFFFLTFLLIFAACFTVRRNGGVTFLKDKDKVKKVKGGNEAAKLVDGAPPSPPSREPVSATAPASPHNDVLSRDQTEEWKGWMQFMFLLYHYYHAEEVYNSIRIMITCYVWMTGFGNFSFFYLKQDYSAVRVLQMLWRLNFLVFFLCLSQGTTYILYYICPLHTFFFGMVYVSMSTMRSLNYSKYGLRIKLACLAFFIFLTWDVDTGLFQLLHFFLGRTPQLGAGVGVMWEWYFRSTLDHWSTFLGMIFAANFPITSLLGRRLEALPPAQHFIAKAAIGAPLLVASYYWATGPFLQGKFDYNATNCYYGFVPLITYIYFRNIHPTLRSYSLNMLHEIGKTTLETYLMQHHIWLTSNAKSLLTLVPGWPKVNFLVVTAIYFFVSRRLYKLTLYLRGMLMPDNVGTCLRSLAAILGAVMASYCAAVTLDFTGVVSLISICVVAVCGGTALHIYIHTKTWKTHVSKGSPEAAAGEANNMLPLVAGAACLVFLAGGCRAAALGGAGKVAALPKECGDFANDGQWVQVNTCNEFQRGVVQIDYGVRGDLSDCGGRSVWGWNVPDDKRCRFVQRNAKSVKTALAGGQVVFVGDSLTRNVYHALCRVLGDTGAGAYSTDVEPHTDITKELAGVHLEFRWAPLASEQATRLAEVLKQRAAPDAIVMGGGLWDTLHSEKDIHEAGIKNLIKEMRAADKAGVPVVWQVPTTINDPALNSEKKRGNMTEREVQKVRDIYKAKGVLSSARFVLDGPSFTSKRAAESYDGVHYPAYVYDAGVQILLNAFDWLVPEKYLPPNSQNEPGKNANVFLGAMMLALSFVGLFFFDGYFGASVLVSKIFLGQTPSELYAEALAPVHEKHGLPAVAGEAAAVFKKNNETDEDVEMSGLLLKDNDCLVPDHTKPTPSLSEEPLRVRR